MISSGYATPVIVNGYSCRNCSDVARAEKNIDPARPEAGPFGVNEAGHEKDAAGKARFDRTAIDSLTERQQANAEIGRHVNLLG